MLDESNKFKTKRRTFAELGGVSFEVVSMFFVVVCLLSIQSELVHNMNVDHHRQCNHRSRNKKHRKQDPSYVERR